MATLSVWKLDTSTAAENAAKTFTDLAREHLIVIHDAAVVEWDEGAKKPRTRQLTDVAGAGALGGSFWGMLFGLIFLVPLLGAAAGAAVGALSGALTDAGIDHRFIEEVRARVTPGTSALFVMTSDAELQKVREAFGDDRPELILANLSDEQERALADVFGA
jgi:uncharacterized membrane protein